VQIAAFSATDVGRSRTTNEDSHLVDAALGLFMVCDGMGGHAAGEIASQKACETVQAELTRARARLEAVARGEQPIDVASGLLRDAVMTASATIYELGARDKTKRGMGTTCCSLLVLGSKAVMAHVGDSRLYLLRQGQLYQMSDDHSFLAEAIKHGVLTEAQAAESTHRNMVTRAVGPQASVQVDLLVFDVLPSDTLLLCSDGLHQYTPNALELVQLLGAGAVQATANKLVQLANERGGVDNITAVLLHAEAEHDSSQVDSQRASEVHAQFDAMRSIELFRDMTLPELARILHVAQTVDVPAGQLLVREGDTTESLYVIVDGAVRVQRDGQTVADLASGCHFGEMALLSQRPRTATVIARVPSRLLVLERSAFFGLVQQEPTIASKFLWKLAQTLSLRLDDVYLVQERLTELDLPAPSGALGGAASGSPKTTARFGSFPSPFARGDG
jgi:serine/threonine protein phosphatase PrpC/CRP-like cAMP-binding protein